MPLLLFNLIDKGAKFKQQSRHSEKFNLQGTNCYFQGRFNNLATDCQDFTFSLLIC